MSKAYLALAALAALWAQLGAKAMFYSPGDPDHGIHYWLQSDTGVRMTERMARALTGKFTLHIRSNTGGGWLTVWDVSGQGRELTPKDPDPRVNGDGRWSGYRMSDAVYVVPGTFEFTRDDSPAHVIIVWARSQTEVAHSAREARRILVDMPAFMTIVTEFEDFTPGEIGAYVMNRANGGVVTEIVFRAR